MKEEHQDKYKYFGGFSEHLSTKLKKTPLGFVCERDLMEKLGKNSGRDEEEEDRMSALPDELIHRILYFGVGLDEVVQTCVLSKRWVNLWSTFPYLYLKRHPLSHGNDGIYRNNAIYCNFITKFLLNRNQHSGTCLVAIDFQPFDQCVRGMVLSILSHAVSHSVRHIHIYNAKIDSYLSFPALRTLLLNQCEVALTKWSLPYLTTLYLENVFPYGEDFSFKEFLCLKNLSIGECTGAFSPTDPEVVRIDPPNLETFTIYQGNTMPPNCVFVVSAPKLKCFRFDGRYVPVFYGEGGFPCLEVVVFYIDIGNGEKVIFDPDIGMYTYDDYNLEDENQVNEIMLKISSLFCEFGQTKVLTLFLGTIQVLSRVQDFSKYQPSPFLNLNSLYLIDYVPPGPPLPIYDHQACSTNHVINYLLSNSPGAEIIMKMSEDAENASDAD